MSYFRYIIYSNLNRPKEDGFSLYKIAKTSKFLYTFATPNELRI